MGDPKYPRKVWRKPKRPLNYELKMDELQTLGTFGLRTKKRVMESSYRIISCKTTSKIITCIDTKS